jgi:hypothetical protein
MGLDVLFSWLIDKIEECYPFQIIPYDEAGVHTVTIPLVKWLRWLIKSIPPNGQWVENIGPGAVARMPFMSEIRTVSVKKSYRDTEDIPIRAKDGKTMLVSLALKLRVHNPRRALLEVEDWQTSLVTDAHNVIALWVEQHDAHDIRIQRLIDECFEPIRVAALEWGVTVTAVGVNSLAEQDVHYIRGIQLT